MIKKVAAAGIFASFLGLGLVTAPQAQARGFGHRTSFSSPSSHSSYHYSSPHAQAPHATAPMAPPAAAPARPSTMGTIASTAAGTAGGVVAGNALSHAFEGNGEGKSENAAKPESSHDNSAVEAVPVVAPQDSSRAAAKGLPEASDPCTAENENKNPRIEELCGQLHQELRKMNSNIKQQADQK